MNFQERFKDLLIDKNIKYSTLSKITRIPITTLSNYINRGSLPSITQLNILADFFEVSIDYLVGRADDFGNVTVSGQLPEQLPNDEQRLIRAYKKLDKLDKEKLIEDAEYYAKRYGDNNFKSIKK